MTSGGGTVYSLASRSMLAWLAILALLSTLAVTASAQAADVPPPADAKGQPGPTVLVRSLLRKHAAACGFRVIRVSARRAGARWRVAAVVSGEVRGTSQWIVAGRRVAPANPLARTIRSGCPSPPTVDPPPAPAPPAPPPPAPGAPADYVWGAGVSAQQQELLRRGLDTGARYLRSAFGRELPRFTVWGNVDVEAMIQVHVATSQPSSLENSRNIWTRGTVAVGDYRKAWFGPAWFEGAANPANATKIAVHEAVHVLQAELAGPGALRSGTDDVPLGGPRWLAEGTAEYLAYLAVAQEGLLALSESRARWTRTASTSPTSLRALATLRGQFETPGAFDVFARAADVLTAGRDVGALLAYYEALGRGVAWEQAFAASFGRTIEAFYAEFEASRGR